MNINTTARSAFTAVRRHPVLAAVVCVPVVAACVVTGSSMASATPTPTLAVASGAMSAAPPADVHVADNALPQTGAVVKPTPVTIPWHEDGCDHDYGTGNLCVPWLVPGSTPEAKCAWLKSNGFGALKVYGTNRQNLPEDAQGYVCASGA